MMDPRRQQKLWFSNSIFYETFYAKISGTTRNWGTNGTHCSHERLLPLQNWTEKRFIFSNTGVHSGDKSGNRISRNVWPFEKLRVENWQICLNTTGRIFIILPRLMVILPALFDFSRPWRFISAQKSYWTLNFCHILMLSEEK